MINLSQRVWINFVWILRHFSGDISFLLPFQILLNNVFPKESSICFVILVTGLRIISPLPRHSEQACSILSGLLFSFPQKIAQRPTRLCWRDVCCPYFWHSQCSWNCCLWLALFIVLRSGKDGRYGFKVFQEHRRLAFVLVRLIWFRETAKLSKSVV